MSDAPAQVQLPPPKVEPRGAAGGNYSHIEIIKPSGVLVCARWCNFGDVIKVMKMGEVPNHGDLMPIAYGLEYQKAQKLVEMGVAKSSPGPATIDSVLPTEDASMLRVVARGEQAVAQPQRAKQKSI